MQPLILVYFPNYYEKKGEEAILETKENISCVLLSEH